MPETRTHHMSSLFPNAKLCTSFWQRLRGFMFYRTPPGKTLILQNVKMIHMFFVFFPLGIIVVNKDNVVVDVFVIKPWHISKYYPAASFIIEIDELRSLNRIRIGDLLKF